MHPIVPYRIVTLDKIVINAGESLTVRRNHLAKKKISCILLLRPDPDSRNRPGQILNVLFENFLFVCC